MEKELKYYKDFCRSVTFESGKIIKKYFRTEIRIDTKDDMSPVTVADRKAEELIRERIIKEFPQHGILGEEFGEYNSAAEYKWTLDPIDGTKSFICGALSFGTILSLSKNGIPVLGVFHQPVLDEFLVGDGKTAELNDNKVRVRDCDDLKSAVVLTTDHLNVGNYQNLSNFERLIRKVNIYRNWGDCYGYYLVATGFADVMVDPIMSKWDTLPLIPIIEGAGGIITDYQGKDPLQGESIIAASEGVHKTVVKILNEG
jgi:myo-inositol-1(or 4)-monophosphatase